MRIFSTRLLRTKLKTLDRMRIREEKVLITIIRNWQDVVYACASDAQRAADRHADQAPWVDPGYLVP